MPPAKGRDLASDHRFSDVVAQLTTGYKTVGEMVYTVLREAIVTGAFGPGEWLRQESLAEAIGVSRIPVRTALLQLEAEGMVTFHPHRGAQVRTLSEVQINEIYRLRMLLERYALQLSMAKMRPERIQCLRELAAEMEVVPEGPGLVQLRTDFYREVYDAESNPLAVEMIEELRGHVGRYLLSFRVHLEQHHSHGELVDHMERGDLAAAEDWLTAHLEEVRRGIQSLVATNGGPAAAAETAS